MDVPIDVGVREVVELLNRIPGVATRASCEGDGRQGRSHRHAAAAYVACRQPWPLRLQEFLRAQVGALARIEDDGLYSRWPAQNDAFIAAALAAIRQYLAEQAQWKRLQLCWPLPKIRARLARCVSAGRPFCVELCLQCGELRFEPHAAGHRVVVLLRGEPDVPAKWFAEFAQQPRNVLAAALVACDGWNALLARTRRGEFGSAFQRRWLRYRGRRLADLSTRGIWSGVAEARSQRSDLDCFYTATQLVVEWSYEDTQTT